MENLEVHANIVEKLTTKHKVTVDEVTECFGNVTRGFLVDTREDHKTDPPTHWFISETNHGRKLFVAFVHFKKSNKIVLKSAYPADDKRIKIYNKLTRI